MIPWLTTLNVIMKHLNRHLLYPLLGFVLLLPGCGKIEPEAPSESNATESLPKAQTAESEHTHKPYFGLLMEENPAVVHYHNYKLFYVNETIVPPSEVAKLRGFLDSLSEKQRFYSWFAFDDYPERRKGEYVDGFFTDLGLRNAFFRVSGLEPPASLKPIIGKVSSISSRPQFSVTAYYKVPPEQVEALAKKVADSWRAKFPVSKGSLPWSLVGPKPRMPPGAPGQYGLAYGPRTFSYRLEDPDSPPHHTRSIVADPDSGLISLSHWEGDQD